MFNTWEETCRGEFFFRWKEKIQCIINKDYEQIGSVLLKQNVTESMFTSWFKANKTYEYARLLTYGQFITKVCLC